jgi:hypothetical protein
VKRVGYGTYEEGGESMVSRRRKEATKPEEDANRHAHASFYQHGVHIHCFPFFLYFESEGNRAKARVEENGTHLVYKITDNPTH